jgi:hypothetical protein
VGRLASIEWLARFQEWHKRVIIDGRIIPTVFTAGWILVGNPVPLFPRIEMD